MRARRDQRVEARIRLDQRADRLGCRHRLPLEASVVGQPAPRPTDRRHHPAPADPRSRLSHVPSVVCGMHTQAAQRTAARGRHRRRSSIRACPPPFSIRPSPARSSATARAAAPRSPTPRRSPLACARVRLRLLLQPGRVGGRDPRRRRRAGAVHPPRPRAGPRRAGAWSAASSMPARRPRTRCAARCAKRSASPWSTSPTSARSRTRYPYRGLTYHVVDLIFVARIAAGAEARALDGVAALEWHDPVTLEPASLAFPSMTGRRSRRSSAGPAPSGPR